VVEVEYQRYGNCVLKFGPVAAGRGQRGAYAPASAEGAPKR